MRPRPDTPDGAAPGRNLLSRDPSPFMPSGAHPECVDAIVTANRPGINRVMGEWRKK